MNRLLIFLIFIAAGAVAGWGFSRGIEGFTLASDPRAELPPCFEVGAPFHHRFRPDCAGMMQTPRGPVRLSVNEDGLREIARSHVLRHARRILVMGDSMVEGWWNAQGETISALLGEHFPAHYFVNGGLRSTGPVMQAASLRRILGIYKPRGIIWMLNDTDAMDDRLACVAQADGENFGAPEFSLAGWRKTAVGLLGSTAAAGKLRRRFYQENWQALVQSEAAGRCDPCRAVETFQRVAAGIPILALYLPLSPLLHTKHYYQLEASRKTLLECLKKSGLNITMMMENPTKEEIDRYFWDNDIHTNPEGTMFLTDEIAPVVEGWLRKLAP